MQWTLMLAALIVAVLLAAALIGWKLPPAHQIAREAEFPQGADTVWSAINGFPEHSSWMPGVRRVQRLEVVDGRERWLYDTAEGDMTIEVVARAAPTALTIRTVNTDVGFAGTWTHRISPSPKGCVVAMTESGWITNPLFRFMFRYVFGYASTLDNTLAALGRHLGTRVTPRPARAYAPRPREASEII